MKPMNFLFLSALFVLGVLFVASAGVAMEKGGDLMTAKPEGYPSVTLAGGCFWCTESEYRALDGVLFTRVGYMGGDLDSPSYQDITTGKTGHAEVVEVTYDPDKISYEDLLTFFFTKAHDPTQLNRQGVDVGTQYRSAIFYANEEEKLTQSLSVQGFNILLNTNKIEKTHCLKAFENYGDIVTDVAMPGDVLVFKSSHDNPIMQIAKVLRKAS
jgi:methionine-S-sulfoxide reductase